MSKNRSITLSTALRSTFLIGILVLSWSAHASGVGPDDGSCAGATFMDLNSSLRGHGDDGTESRLFRVEIPSSGLMAVDVAVPGPALADSKLGLLGPDCSPVREASVLEIEESPARAIVDLSTPGTYFFRVASQDPELKLGEYKLRVGFVSHESSVHEPREYSKNDPASSEEEDDIDEREIDEILLADPGAGNPKSSGSVRRESSFALRLRLVHMCRLGEVDDHGDVFTCATPSKLGERTTGEIRNTWGDDDDVFTFVVSAQQTVRIETRGETDTFGGLYDRRGQRLAKDNDSGTGANLRIVRTLGPGRYFVRVEGRDGSEGTYSLTVETSSW